MTKTTIAALLATMLLSGCASPPPKPTIDPSSMSDQALFQKDLTECVVLADYFLTSERTNSIAAATGGTIGAATTGTASALSSSILGSVPMDMAAGFGVGAVMGVVAEDRDREIDRNAGAGRCMEDRGYIITNADKTMLSPEYWCRWTLIRTGYMTWHWDKEKLAACVASEEERQRRLARERGAKRQP